MDPRPRVAELHGKTVVLVTDGGAPVSFGRVRVLMSASSAQTVARVEVDFETVRLKCTLRIPPDKWTSLVEQWDGEQTRYALPHGDGFWQDEREPAKRRVVEHWLQHAVPASPPGLRGGSLRVDGAPPPNRRRRQS